jgi:hypothetical protein
MVKWLKQLLFSIATYNLTGQGKRFEVRGSGYEVLPRSGSSRRRRTGTYSGSTIFYFDPRINSWAMIFIIDKFYPDPHPVQISAIRPTSELRTQNSDFRFQSSKFKVQISTPAPSKHFLPIA